MAEAGRARACALMHPPHVAGYLGRLLQRYSARFRAPHTAALHRAVKRARRVSPYAAAERLWFARLNGVKGRGLHVRCYLVITHA